MTHRQIHPFDKSRVQPTREAQSLQGDCEICSCPEAHHVRDANQFAPTVAFFHLTVDQISRHLPLSHHPPATTSCEPVAKMGCQSIKVQV
jgi:hypothetical protein